VLVEYRPGAKRGLTVGSGNIIPAGATRTLRCYVSHEVYPEYLDEKFYGMFALPRGIVRVWSDIHSDSISRFSLVLIHHPASTTLLVDNIRGEGSFEFLTEEEVGEGYFPLLDEFGQFRHRGWPGKTHSGDELLHSKDDEMQDVSGHPAPREWDKYGGWLKGPQLKATGNFRIEKVDGKWWLVDPDGHLFWSHGMRVSVTMETQATPITERTHYFTNLPDSDSFREFYSERSRITVGYFKDRTVRTFNRYGWIFSRKYGEDWKTESAAFACTRLKSWCINTWYSGTDTDVSLIKDIPYVPRINTRDSRRIEGSRGYWGKAPDPFDKDFSKTIEMGLANISQSVSDPYCIGYFVDNEMNWEDDSYLATAVLQSDWDQPAKLAMLEYLKSKYRTVSRLNSAWQSGYESWDDFLEGTEVPSLY